MQCSLQASKKNTENKDNKHNYSSKKITLSQKTIFLFKIIRRKNEPILIIFGVQNPEEIIFTSENYKLAHLPCEKQQKPLVLL